MLTCNSLVAFYPVCFRRTDEGMFGFISAFNTWPLSISKKLSFASEMILNVNALTTMFYTKYKQK